MARKNLKKVEKMADRLENLISAILGIMMIIVIIPALSGQFNVTSDLAKTFTIGLILVVVVLFMKELFRAVESLFR